MIPRNGAFYALGSSIGDCGLIANPWSSRGARRTQQVMMQWRVRSRNPFVAPSADLLHTGDNPRARTSELAS